MEQELKNTWLNSMQVDQLKINYSALIQVIKQGAEVINKNIKTRDFRETAASLFGIPVFGYFFLEIPYPITKFACALAVAYFIYVIYKLRDTRNSEPKLHFDLDLRSHLKEQKSYLKRQQKLIHNALYWYVIPPFVMNVVFIVGIGNPADYAWDGWLMEILPDSFREKCFYLIGLSLFYAYIAWMNRKAAKDNFQPTIDQINRMEEQLSAEQ